MKKEHFLALVLASVLDLKAKATPEELGKLNYEKLNPFGGSEGEEGCILAQMTDWSNNTYRARELAPRTLGWGNNDYEENPDEYVDYRGVTPIALKEAIFDILIETEPTTLHVGGMNNHFAPFEIFILFPNVNTQELIEFLRGERETFEPRFEVPVEA